MSIVGSPTKLVIAFLLLVLILSLLIISLKRSSWGLSLAILFISWISFKHGFVRQDNHMIVFFMLLPFLSVLILLEISRFQSYFSTKLVHYIFAIILVICMITGWKIHQELFRLSPQSVFKQIQMFTQITDLKNWQIRMNEASENNLKMLKLSQEVNDLVKGKAIDVIPWEISLMPANDLNWQARPILQSYSAYTQALDQANALSLSTKPRDFIFYQFQAIDTRHPFFDEPDAFFYIFCHYQPSARVSTFINTELLKHLILLERRSNSRCVKTNEIESTQLLWNQFYNLPIHNQKIIRVKVKIKYSLFGKIYKTLFRVPPVSLVVKYRDGDQQVYRVIPENSQNGIIISHLPKNDQEALSFLQGNLPTPVNSFSFSNLNNWLYQKTIELTFSSSKIDD